MPEFKPNQIFLIVSEHEFMEFSEIENHDDFYSVDEKGFVHVQDQRGYFIMYDSAINDLKKLENELLMVASYYIAKDKETFGSKSAKNQDEFINVGLYSHQNVDRFSVLLDIWINEVNFLEMKKNLLDIYIEVYQNIFDKNEKRNVAQVITNIMHQRVRFDLQANYFSHSYRLEVSCLYKQCRILKLILDKMIDEMRNYLEKVEDSSFGLPLNVIKKSPVNLSSNVYGQTLKNLYLLEFHPCLASASRLPSAFRQSIEELIYFKSIQNVTERLLIEQNFYKIYLDKLERLDPPGSGFTPQIQREIFNGTFIEDPNLMCDFVQQGLNQVEEKAKHKTRKEQNEAVLKFLSDILEMVTLRQRLLSASFETEVLSTQYRRMATELGFEEFHMYLRYVQFDFAKYKENAGDPPPVFVSELSSDDSQIDRYVPNSLLLAISELEEGQIGRLSFKAKENVQHVMRPGGLENLQLIVKLQLLHNNVLISAIMQVNACLLNTNLAARNSKNSVGLNNPANFIEEDKYNENSMFDIKQFIGMSSSTIENQSNIRIANPISRLKKYSDAFVSVQLEKIFEKTIFCWQNNLGSIFLLKSRIFYNLKTQIVVVVLTIIPKNRFPRFAQSNDQVIEQNPYRDLMLNEYINQKESKGLLLSNPAEMEKLKRNLMIDYANNFTKRCTIDYIQSDPRTFKKRPRKLLSDDGQRVLNLWFIPHYTDLLLLYKKNCSNEQSVKALKHSVRILSAFNDILNYWYANACMNIAANTSAATDSSISSVRKKIDFSSWENSGGLDTELNELQLEMNQLSDPCDPSQVVELLEIKRSSMILQYDCAIRHAVRDIFLANGNIEAFRQVNEKMHFSLKFLNDYSVDTDENVYLNVPEPFDCRDEQASELFPWRTFISKESRILHYHHKFS
ncbi:transmembrane protein -like [Brachionus plicatilis]|uniref:Transmembrane protein-like n=1 Tax=Brachionus plicatilis TaxID=10195 RepID=A0A3M7SID5_BRAPC|nr:transmembrane protein -like [Brachionus plicatilis]